MLLESVFAALASLIVFSGGMWYSIRTVKREIHPTLVTIFIWEMGAAIGFLTYLSKPNHSLFGNVLNMVDALEISGVLLVVVMTRPRYKRIYFVKLLLTPRRFFRMFRRLPLTYQISLVASFATTIFWKITHNPNIAFGCFQGIMAIAYVPLFERLWKARKNPEDYRVWIMMLLASTCGLYSPIKRRDVLGLLYSLRALISVIVALSIMYRIKRNALKQKS